MEGDKLANYLTMVGHACADVNQGALSAVLPFLVVAHGWSYAEVAVLVLAANIASAVIQPLFGWIGDKRPCPWFMALGVFLAGLGVCGIGLAESYGLVVASAMLSGTGVAMFHPEGGRLANLAAGARKAGGMSIFAVGGNVGFFVGPILTAASCTAFGLAGTVVFLVPAAACALVLLGFNRRFTALGTGHDTAGEVAGTHEYWGKFALVMAVASLRSIVVYGLLAFIPLYLMGVLGQSESASSLALSAYSLAGAFATALSGRTSERFGVHKLLICCFAAIAVLAAAFSVCGSVPLALALAMLLAVAVNLFYASSVALGMSYVPQHLGTASGLLYGFAMCTGGIAEPFLGMAGDAAGVGAALLIIAAVGVVGAVVSVAIKCVDRA